MKIRNGFVSNSSSSSFVAVGFDISKLDRKKVLEAMDITIRDPKDDDMIREDIHEGAYDIGLHILQGEEDGVEKDAIVLCDFIADGDEYETTKTPLASVEKNFSILKEIKDKIDPEAELFMYSGIRMC